MYNDLNAKKKKNVEENGQFQWSQFQWRKDAYKFWFYSKSHTPTNVKAFAIVFPMFLGVYFHDYLVMTLIDWNWAGLPILLIWLGKFTR